MVFCPEKQLLLKPHSHTGHKAESETLSSTNTELSVAHTPGKVVIVAKNTLVEEEAMRQLHVASKMPGCL